MTNFKIGTKLVDFPLDTKMTLRIIVGLEITSPI